jgi:hypothetical protein
VARCDESIDEPLRAWVANVVPAGIRFSVLVYEYCGDSIRWSLDDNRDHIAHVALPSHIDSVELTFAYHIQTTKAVRSSRRQHIDVNLFASASALFAPQLQPWLRCARLLPTLLAAMPEFGVLAADLHPHASAPSPSACIALQQMRSSALCATQLVSCVGPNDLFWTSGQRLMTCNY